ncbi:MAG TPA: CPBP family intramembrane metalloprotease [Candidatus Coprenecus pullistercoris]|nr:CPBP family intramembrane metalloprotease [Candidatus Coprenecus pullistercoris]
MKKIRCIVPGLGESWLILLLIVIGQVAASLIQGAAGLYGDMYMPFVYVLSFVPAVAYCLFPGRRKCDSLLRPVSVSFGTLGPWLFIPLAVMVELAVIYLLSSVPFELKMPPQVEIAFAAMYGRDVVWTLLTVSVAAPLLEELMFRRIILSGLLRRMSAWKAVAWSSLLFAVAHLNPWQALPAFAMGCLFGWIYYRTRSYWTVVSLHAVNNTLTIVVAKVLGVQTALEGSMQDIVGEGLFYPLLAASFVIAVSGVLIINKSVSSSHTNIQ